MLWMVIVIACNRFKINVFSCVDFNLSVLYSDMLNSKTCLAVSQWN